jgi:prepilin-type processing-associated H-X9-DG protein
MTRRVASSEESGFTKWDLLIVVAAVLGLLAALLFPAMARAKGKSRRISCVCNLKQIGLALRMWSKEGGERFPWQIGAAAGGTGELLGQDDAFRHFLAVSNELTSPKVLVCPSDSGRTRVGRWEDFTSNKHLSYFIGLDADETRPQSILSGDRNLGTNGLILSGLVALPMNAPLTWAKTIHDGQGNVGLGDGSVQQMTAPSVRRQVLAATNEALRLLIP